MNKIKKLFITDLHFGKGRLKDLKNKLISFVAKNPECKGVDYIILAGDTYDKQISLGSSASLESISWLIHLGKYCIIHNIKLRILEGTPSHDRNQVRMFETIVNSLMPELNFIYIDDIEVITETDHTCLYIPDEIRVDTKTSFLSAVEILDDMGLDRVDSCVLHGAYKHSMGFGTASTLHVEEDYLDLVKGFTVSGHIHTHQTYDRLITPGSFERLTFGDEGAKGAVMTIESTCHTEDSFKFVENEDTAVFRDLIIPDGIYTTSDLIEFITPLITVEPEKSNFRLVLDRADIFDSGTIMDLFSGYNISFKEGHYEDELEIEVDDTEQLITDLSEVSVNRLIRDRLTEKGIADSVLDNVMSLLVKGT